MTASFIARRRQLLRGTGQRLREEHRAMANAIGRLFLQAATARSETGERVIPNRRSTRDGLMAAIYAQVLKPYYIGAGEEPFVAGALGARPLSPYAQLLYEGVRDMVRLAAEQQAALVRRIVRDETVLAWLLSPYQPRQTVQEMSFSSFTQWLDPRGFRLTERIQRVAIEVRSRLARFVDYHVGSGTPAPTMVTKVEAFLTTGEKGNTTYGNHGSNAPRVLVQHEMNKAGGDTVKAATVISPYIRGAQWLLSPAHTESDECDDYAEGGENGDGVYPLSELPVFPAHPKCMCGLRAASVRNPAAVTAALAAAIGEVTEAAQALRGALDPERVTAEALTGAIQQTIDQVQAAPLPVPTAPTPPVKPAQTLVPTPSAEAKAEASGAARRTLDQIVAERGGTADEYIARARENFRNEVVDKKVEISIHGQHLDTVLRTGKYQNAFEVAAQFPESPVAARLADYRAMHEVAGIARDAPASARPIYGYVNTGQSAQNAAGVYGETRIVLRDEIKQRLTYTPNDSMTPLLERRMAPATLANVDGAMFGSEIGKWVDTRNKTVLYNRIPYVEVQIYGGVGLTDIESVIFDYGDLRVLTAGRFDQLRQANIAIQVKDDARLFTTFAQLIEEYADYVS